ncbi:MAG: urease accessory protein [Lewinellaceae bacterium]|nr:urease accessory protein [Lewinellaceae bacterium]
MDLSFSLLLAAAVGFSHAFEADHLLAVSSMVTKRNRFITAIKDGVFWGLGHTSTIMLIGLLMVVGKFAIAEQTFTYFEAGVGVMLVVLGIWRLGKLRLTAPSHHHHHHLDFDAGGHHVAYGVGLVHGLAGSGTLVVLVMSQLKTAWGTFSYLLLFGLGSIVGMLLASGVFSLPFSRRWSNHHFLQRSLVLLSSLLCIGFGIRVLWENLFV